MSAHSRSRRFLIALIALSLLVLFVRLRTPTGAAVLQCPVGYISAGNYCVEQACQDKQAKCLRQGSYVKRPDCTCTAYQGKFVCGIQGGEKTAVKLPTCTRRGHLNSVCGSYDSKTRRCVENQYLLHNR